MKSMQDIFLEVIRRHNVRPIYLTTPLEKRLFYMLKDLRSSVCDWADAVENGEAQEFTAQMLRIMEHDLEEVRQIVEMEKWGHLQPPVAEEHPARAV